MPNLGVSCSHLKLVKNGNTRLELHFNTPPMEIINVIIYTEFKNLLQIDRDRNVFEGYNTN